MTLLDALHRVSLAGGQHVHATANIRAAVLDWLRERKGMGVDEVLEEEERKGE